MTPENVSVNLDKLSDHIAELRIDWQKYRTLFGTTGKRVDLLNEMDAPFWALVQSMFHQWICLGLCRLGDPASSGKGRDNLTLERLSNLTLEHRPSATAAITQALDAYRSSTAKFQTIRNKLYGHNDLARQMSGPGDLYSRQDVEEAFTAAGKFMNAVRHEFGETPMIYELSTAERDSDANATLKALIEARRYRDFRDQGVIPREDIIEAMRQYQS